jgi:cyanate permease
VQDDVFSTAAVETAFLSDELGQFEIEPLQSGFGLTIGNILMMHQLLLAEAFGSRQYGRIYSVSQLVSVIGVAGGPTLIGFIFTATGGYEWPYLSMAVSTLIGTTALSLSGPSRR